MTMGREDKKKILINCFPRFSVIVFVLILFIFLLPDIQNFLDNAPLLFNFSLGFVSWQF